MLEAFAVDRPGCCRKGEGRINRTCQFGRAAKAVPHLPFEPTFAERAAMQHACGLLLERSQPRRPGYRRVCVIQRGLRVSKGCCRSREASLMDRKVEAG